MPELIFDTQEAVPEPFRESAVAKDGKFAINVVNKSEVDTFRENNLNLSRERDGLAGTIARLRTDAGLDPDKLDEFVTGLADLRTTAQRVADGELVANSTLEEALNTRTGEMRQQHEAQVQALTTSVNNLRGELDTARKAIDDNVIVNEVTAAATDPRSGLRGDAIRAVIREAREFFQVKDGKLVPMEDGKIVYGTDGTSPMKPLEWIKSKLTQSSPYLFQESKGGGSQGGSGVGGMTQEQLAQLSPAERMRLSRAQS
jgi:hypothetical protein